MAIGFPVKADYATGDVLSAANMNDLSGTVNILQSTQYAAGKNAIINGGMDIWQRGTSVALTASSSNYVTDRFYSYRGTLATGGTVSRQLTSDTTNLPNIQYCARVQRDSGNTSTQPIVFVSDLETVNSIPYAGKTVTLSFYARAGANYSATSNALSVTLFSGTGTDQAIRGGYTNQLSPISETATLTTTWQRFSYSASIGSNVTQLGLYILTNPTGTAGANDYFEVTGVQLEVGSTATTFSRAGGTIQGELAACQRYFYQVPDGLSETIGMAFYLSATELDLILQLPVQMRTTPTLTQTSGTDYFKFTRNGGADNFNSFTLAGESTTATIWAYNNSQASGTAGQAGLIQFNNALAKLAFSAEL